MKFNKSNIETDSSFLHMVKMPNFSGVPLVGLGSQRLRPEGSRQAVDVHQSYFAPCYGYSRCTPCAYIPRHGCCYYRALPTQLHPMQQNNSFHALRRCYACNQLGHIAKFCNITRPDQCRNAPFVQPSGFNKSAKRLQRDRDRMGAFNAHKALMANLPFAEVPDDELIKLVPKPAMNQQNKVLRRIMAIDPNYDDCPKPREGIWSFFGKNEKLKLKNSALERKSELLEKQNTEFCNQIADLKTKLLKTEIERNELKEDVQYAETENAQLKDKISNLQQEIDTFADTVQSLKQKCAGSDCEKNAEILELRQDLCKANKLLSDERENFQKFKADSHDETGNIIKGHMIKRISVYDFIIRNCKWLSKRKLNTITHGYYYDQEGIKNKLFLRDVDWNNV